MRILEDTTNLRFRDNQVIDESCNATANYEAVAITLSLPLWTFVTFYLVFILIHYLRSIQYFQLYDRCTTKQAHFRYDFHILIGRYSSNYSALESHLTVDLIDNQMIPTMTIQIPGSSIFNDQQVFMYKHSRANVRCVSFTIYRRHPIKDVRCIRVAHGCSNPESRIFVHGVNCRDLTNGESKFFPITSAIKYRGTQWALNTTFEPKQELSFTKLGCSCYDPFGISRWPTYVETLIILFYIWCATLCFGSLIPVDSLNNNIILHIVVITFIVGSTAGAIIAIHLKVIKTHVVDEHYESYTWQVFESLWMSLVFVLCFGFWFLATKQLGYCKGNSIDWIISSSSSALLLNLIVLITLFFMSIRKKQRDSAAFEEHENSMMKTNSKTNIDFIVEVAPTPLNRLRHGQHGTHQGAHQNHQPISPNRRHTSKSVGKKSTTSTSLKKTSVKKKSPHTKGNSNETLDNTGNDGSGYLKTKNRNSISQYV